MKYKIERNTVQETLILPLYSRKLCSELYPNLYRDETAVRLIDQIDYDFSVAEKNSRSLMQRFGALEVAMRQCDLAWEVRDYLKTHPCAAVFFASGVFYYFLTQQVRELVQGMADAFPGGVLVFDLCALLFVFFLVVFANKYQLECRSRELGLYLMFGMTKIKLFIQIMTEGLITSFLALLGGLVCGGFLSEAISLTTARLVGHGIITHQLSFSVSAAIFTSLGFLIIQFVALFVLCGKLFRKELHQLVYGEMAKKQRTGNPYVSFVSFAIGTVILLVAYWIVVEHFMAASGAMLLIAVLLGIIGTILFIRGLARILSIWAASIKHKATRGLYVFTLRQLHENVVNKYISISVASILMMLTIMLITDGSVRIMSYGSELTRGTSVYDFTVIFPLTGYGLLHLPVWTCSLYFLLGWLTLIIL